MHERRKSDRYCFNLELQPNGELLLLVDNKTWGVWKLVDISPFGSCLSMAVQFKAGSKIALHYKMMEKNKKHG